MECYATLCSVFASSILCHTFICPRIFLLEIGDYKNSIGIFHFDFPWERDTTGSSPAYFWDRAAGDKENKLVVTAVSGSDECVITH